MRCRCCWKERRRDRVHANWGEKHIALSSVTSPESQNPRNSVSDWGSRGHISLWLARGVVYWVRSLGYWHCAECGAAGKGM